MRCSVLTVSLVTLVTAVSALANVSLVEDFSSGIRADRWSVFTTNAADAPWTVVAPDAAGTLRTSKAAENDPGTAATNLFAGITSQFTVDGDMSAFTDFSLLSFPNPEGEGWNEAAIRVTLKNSGVSFYSLRFAAKDAQLSEAFCGIYPWVLGFVEDATMTGRLGITRNGNTMRAWIDRGSGPTLLGSMSSDQLLGPMEIAVYAVQAVNYDIYPAARPHTALDVRFDNVTITADSIVFVPAPGALLLCVVGLSAVGWAKRRMD